MNRIRNLMTSKKEGQLPSTSHTSEVATISGPTSDEKKLQLSKELVDFGLTDLLMPINEPIYDQLDLLNISSKKIKFSFDAAWPSQCELSFDPTNGSIEKGKIKRIKVKLIINSPININFRLPIRVDGGEAYFVNLRIRCELGVFGVDPAELETTEDGGYTVPTILVEMKKSLIEHQGLEQEGIFRLAGDQTQVQKAKADINKTKHLSDHEPNTVATLLKIWFRELPSPILNSLSKECIYQCDEVEKCRRATETLPESKKILLFWLLDVLVRTCSMSSVNKMTAQNLAIVVAPNLYEPPGADPMEGLLMSQKSVQFLLNLLRHRVENPPS